MGKLADDLLREDIIRVAQGIAALMDELKELAEDASEAQKEWAKVPPEDRLRLFGKLKLGYFFLLHNLNRLFKRLPKPKTTQTNPQDSYNQ